MFFFSDIQKNDSFELRRALRTHEIDTIVLASPGGSVWEGLNMAGIIFDKKMTVYVPPLPVGEGCYSACAYMFFAGNNRLAVGELGVHQIGAYGSGVDSEKRKVGETQQATQFTTSEVIGFLNEFGTPPWVYERMFRSREIYAFTEDEKKDISQGLFDPVAKRSIDVFLAQLHEELEKAEKTEPATPTAEGFDKSDREMVKALQVLLNEATCSAGVADGVWGSQTNAAAKRFANANKLPYAGPVSIDKAFLESLVSDKRKTCSTEPQKRSSGTLPKSWKFHQVCNGQEYEGVATFNHHHTWSSGQEDYGFSYKNSLGATYLGSGSVMFADSISSYVFNFKATSNQKYETWFSGKIVKTKGGWYLSGKLSNGCEFSGYAK